MRPGSVSLIFVIGLTLGCSPGPGRDPRFPDARVVEDAAEVDAGRAPDAAPPLDAGPTDAKVVLYDAGPPPAYVFSGVWGVQGESTAVFARELDRRLMLIVGAFPFVYTGTIAADGAVDLVSHVLARSGCATARIGGRYDRANAFLDLVHTSCSVSDGRPFTTTLRGGFDRDYAHDLSGEYTLEALIVADANGCFGPRRGPFTVRYGINFDAGQVAVFTAYDVISTPTVYLGRAGAGGAFSATSQALASRSNLDVAMSGRFEQPTALDPVRFVGQRDVIDPLTGCAFQITLDGHRVAGP